MLCVLKGKMPFKMPKIIIFSHPAPPPPQKKLCVLPTLNFQIPLPETHLFFYLALVSLQQQNYLLGIAICIGQDEQSI